MILYFVMNFLLNSAKMHPGRRKNSYCARGNNLL